MLLPGISDVIPEVIEEFTSEWERAQKHGGVLFQILYLSLYPVTFGAFLCFALFFLPIGIFEWLILGILDR